ncbi:MAG TPA: sigma 54-interacting transcriptional regulator [Polyangiaceae bacterium]|jgi:transcriptional regulator with GAF, ATPase, and Fis domain|nr:sigma 54-interacting transcriptional regulator [Polyangiaceae bacterium]
MLPSNVPASSLTHQQSPDSPTLWRALRQLVERVGAALEGQAVIDDCLDVVVELLDADRGLVVLENGDGTTAVVHARGPRKKLAPGEQEAISRTLTRRALDSNGFVLWQGDGESAESPSINMLRIHAALVAPLRGRGTPRGVLYVDFRHPLKYVEPAHQEFFMAAVVLIGGMLEQGDRTRLANERLREAHSHVTEAARTPSLDELLRPPSMARLRDEISLALAGTSPVLVVGESGAGKTLFAQALAEASGRRPIVRVVLGSSDDLNTIASELFGHEKGAFSGATGKRVGLVEYADGGTLVLDELLNLPLQAQKVLLDFTQFGTYRPLGYSRPQPKRADVRIVAATNGDLRAAIREGRFREDLYYRLAGITLRIPPLRERRDEIPSLAEGILRSLDRSGRWTLSIDARIRLAKTAHGWPGNIRELEWIVRRANHRVLARGGAGREIAAADLGDLGEGPAIDAGESLLTLANEEPAAEWKRLQEVRAHIEAREAELVRHALDRHENVIAHAAKDLGVARTTLAGRAQTLGLLAKR